MKQSSGKFLKQVVAVMCSNMTSLLSGVLAALLIPKILTVTDYGLYKTFTLYVTYIGLLSIGIIDGIVLRYGGYDYDKFDKPRFRSFFDWYLIIHLVEMAVISLFVMIFAEGELRFIFLMLVLNVLAQNLTGYFQQISQITQRFREYSARKVLQSAFNIIAVLVLCLLFWCNVAFNYRVYVIIVVSINALLALWYLFTYRAIVFGKRDHFWKTGKEIRSLILLGIPLLVANLCSTLILTLDRQFVNAVFDTDTYAVYAFAYNIISLITTTTSAIATVLFPKLMRQKNKDVAAGYKMSNTYMLIFAFACLASFFVFTVIIRFFLPAYTDSIPIFRVLFPGVAVSTTITVVMHNYYKVLGKNLRFFLLSLFILAVSLGANFIAYYTAKTPLAISVASAICMLAWYLVMEQMFCSKYGYRRWRNLLYISLCSAAFYGATLIPSLLGGFFAYAAVWTLITFLVHRPTIRTILDGLRRKDAPVAELAADTASDAPVAELAKEAPADSPEAQPTAPDNP